MSAGALKNTQKIRTQCRCGWAPKNSGCQCTLSTIEDFAAFPHIATSTSSGLDPSADKNQSSQGGGVQKKSSTLKITDLKDFNKLSPTSATAASISGTSPVSNSSSVNSIPKEVSPDDPFDNIGKKHALKKWDQFTSKKNRCAISRNWKKIYCKIILFFYFCTRKKGLKIVFSMKKNEKKNICLE